MEFNVGDLVLLSTKALLVHSKCKLVPRWIGPFPIETCVGQLAYWLTLPEMYHHLHPVFHISKLKAYVSGGRDGRDGYVAPGVVDGDYEYEVEKIVAQRGRGSRH